MADNQPAAFIQNATQRVIQWLNPSSGSILQRLFRFSVKEISDEPLPNKVHSVVVRCLGGVILTETSITTSPDPANADDDTVPTIKSDLERKDPDIRDLVNELEREQTLVAQPLVLSRSLLCL